MAVKFLSFDCYDTLVAYSAAKAAAVAAIVGAKGGNAAADAAVKTFCETERALHTAPDFQPLGVVRGGSWSTQTKEELLSSCRNAIPQDLRDPIYGFRCVISRNQ